MVNVSLFITGEGEMSGKRDCRLINAIHMRTLPVYLGSVVHSIL